MKARASLDTTLNAGTTSGPLGASGTIACNGGTLQYSASNTFDYSSRFSTAANQQYNVDTNGQAVTCGGALTSSGGSLTKLGSGMLSLTGTNTHAGTTNVNAGSLAINGSTSTSSAVTVSNADTKLMGTGTAGGATTINSGAILAPGNGGVGKQTFSNTVTMNTGSIFEWELGSTPNDTSGGGVRGTPYDAVNAGGATALAGSGAIFRVVLNGSRDFSSTFWDANHTWTDIFKNADAGSAVSFASLFSSVQYYNTSGGALSNIPATQGYFTPSGSTLTWTAVPEPTSASAGILLGAGLLRRRRK